MTILYKFPRQTAFGRVLPKSKIYEHTSPSSKIKELFVRDVEKITWSYKLSPATVNLPISDDVHEIQVFTIALRTGTLVHEVLETIDKAIPSPISLFLPMLVNAGMLPHINARMKRIKASGWSAVISKQSG